MPVISDFNERHLSVRPPCTRVVPLADPARPSRLLMFRLLIPRYLPNQADASWYPISRQGRMGNSWYFPASFAATDSPSDKSPPPFQRVFSSFFLGLWPFTLPFLFPPLLFLSVSVYHILFSPSPSSCSTSISHCCYKPLKLQFNHYTTDFKEIYICRAKADRKNKHLLKRHD